ncbi:MAG: amidase [Frankiales bacterium]|nr:amidase [Frankiales bacterium]
MDEQEIAFAGVNGQRQLLRDGTVTSAQLLAISLDRIARLDPQLNAFRTLFDTAHAEAAAADDSLRRGDDRPLLGVPIAVKDNIAVAGESAFLGTGSPQPKAEQDAEITRRLRAAGAVLVGATQLPELALWPFTESPTFGVTRNPWNLDHTPGGSSGGSAAAVAAGLVAGAHASDGGGSIRIPAACCGLPGLKPGRGVISLAPDGEHWHGLSSAGCLTRSVADAVTMLNVLQDVRLELTDPGPLRIAWSVKAPQPTGVHPEVRAALDAVVQRLDGLGHTTTHADPSYAGVQESFLVRYATGVADDLSRLADPSRTELRTRAVAGIGRRLRGRPLTRALKLGHEARTRLSVLPGGADLLITPSLATPPRRVGSMQGLSTLARAGRGVPFTPAWNVTGLPAMAVPAGFTADGLPLSVQLVAPPGGEQLLLSVAAQLEDWTELRPRVF